MFQDEAGFGRINKPKYCWCKKGIRPSVPCHHIRECRYAYGTVEPVTGDSFFLIMPYSNTDCMTVFWENSASNMLTTSYCWFVMVRHGINPKHLLFPIILNCSICHLPHLKWTLLNRSGKKFVSVALEMRHLRLWEKWWIVFVIPFARLLILPFQALLDAAGYCLFLTHISMNCIKTTW